MSIEKVRSFFEKFGKEGEILEFEVSSATVSLAADALGVEEGRIAKSLTFMVDEAPILIVTAGDVKINNSKYKKEFAQKAKMLSKDEVKEMVGHEVGGVCPFAINEGVTVYLDQSLNKYDYLYPACGSSNSAIKMTIEDLEKYTGFDKWVDVSVDK